MRRVPAEHAVSMVIILSTDGETEKQSDSPKSHSRGLELRACGFSAFYYFLIGSCYYGSSGQERPCPQSLIG